jgi:hypothetical protein
MMTNAQQQALFENTALGDTHEHIKQALRPAAKSAQGGLREVSLIMTYGNPTMSCPATMPAIARAECTH